MAVIPKLRLQGFAQKSCKARYPATVQGNCPHQVGCVQGYQLRPGTTVAVLIMSSDTWAGVLGPNITPSPRVFMVRTKDDTPPTFVNSTPAIVATYFASGRVSFSVNEPASVFYAVSALNSADAPAPTQLQAPPSPKAIRAAAVSAQTLSTGSHFIAAGIANVTTSYASENVTISGLTSQTRYALWACAEDSYGNIMSAASQVAVFVTKDESPPEFIQLSAVDIGASSAQVVLRLDEPGKVCCSTVSDAVNAVVM